MTDNKEQNKDYKAMITERTAQRAANLGQVLQETTTAEAKSLISQKTMLSQAITKADKPNSNSEKQNKQE